MKASTRQTVKGRAGDRCEYCLLPAGPAFQDHQIDHIIAQKHLGSDDPENLAWACVWCNVNKGTDLAGIDPVRARPVFLFNPRTDVWATHFQFEGAVVLGRTPAGRATIATLKMNAPDVVEIRQMLMELNVFEVT